MQRRISKFLPGAALAGLLLASSPAWLPSEPASQAPLVPKAAAAAPVAEEPQNPLLEPNATMVDEALLAKPLTADERTAMAAELGRLKTRHASELVSVISAANEEAALPIPPSLLLSIAYTETHGKVLAVSGAGAAGLAQATPAAYLLEGLDGPLHITNQYLIGTRAFIMKKPLGDAMNIAEWVAEGEVSHAEGLELLAQAKELRQVGMDELEALVPRAPAVFAQRVQAADEYNAETLATLEGLLEKRAGKARLEAFHDRVRKEYKALMRVQQANWKRYAASLEKERDRVLRAHFGEEPKEVILKRPYEAGEVLGQELDARFSPTQMAKFLSTHLTTKREQAKALGVPEEELEQWTAALYNGGLVNVTRMRAGLMTSIEETQNYMQKVPALREQLDTVAMASP